VIGVRAVVTGGAGFIGSSLAEFLLLRGGSVLVFDSLVAGRRDRIPHGAEVVVGDIRDEAALRSAFRGADVVFHQAALGSVPRSVEAPGLSHEVNAGGTLSVLQAALGADVRRVVAASSSSVYGGASRGPVGEEEPLRPRSPYAASKVAAEAYLHAFTETYGLETVALRYFNVFGPGQRSDGPYAAVVPRFVTSTLRGEPVTIYGDGAQTRDFTFVSDVVDFNVIAAMAPAEAVAGKAFNVGSGKGTSIRALLEAVERAVGSNRVPEMAPPRSGDVRNSLAAIDRARSLGYTPSVDVEEGIRRTVAWFSARR
jgi:nucleoside-diphosphate-sugar epimerase